MRVSSRARGVTAPESLRMLGAARFADAAVGEDANSRQVHDVCAS